MKTVLSQSTMGLQRRREVPERIPDLKAWWRAGDLGLADAANPTPWTPRVNNTGIAFSLIDTGTNASYDLTTLPVPSVDFTGSAGLDDLIRDSRVLCRDADEGMIVAMTYQTTDAANQSIFGLCGIGAFSAASSNFRGFNWQVTASGAIQFRTKGSDNTARTTITSATLVNDTPYVLIAVLDSDNSQHMWANGLLYGGSMTQALSIKHEDDDPIIPHDINLGNGTTGSTAWSPPSVISDWLVYVRAGEITNAEVNGLGSYLATRIGSTWTAVTELAA